MRETWSHRETEGARDGRTTGRGSFGIVERSPNGGSHDSQDLPGDGERGSRPSGVGVGSPATNGQASAKAPSGLSRYRGRLSPPHVQGIRFDRLGETRYATRGDIHIAYQVSGEGPLDLVLVSVWFSHLEWEIPGFAHMLDRLGLQPGEFDKYGIGLSDPAPPGAPPPLEDWMDDVRCVMDAAEVDQAVLMGGRRHDGCAVCRHLSTASVLLILANSSARLSLAPDFPYGLPGTQESLIEMTQQAPWDNARHEPQPGRRSGRPGGLGVSEAVCQSCHRGRHASHLVPDRCPCRSAVDSGTHPGLASS